jgi:hypothetical protein
MIPPISGNISTEVDAPVPENSVANQFSGREEDIWGTERAYTCLAY